ncbi:molybdopterin cofactor-binding domain-containing protein [Pseudonocardia abyssalis]|uniref:Xanthine dehydrogenase family protein molybdopterin-binding subunit n=1 Tax=Pseudonocardia abyssalis TaxID=2792008 RepID=A0ABS6UZ68_9PSEU|nr:molybdopterin cofactor-binding domain-containing protein [Pseudonocardia abyssalis]MBW0115459.1 xanthine dehydrogenase family protein molybdopterin-binding subunit [Pseudonocardia abyssalis]MBW0137188.1 xanthine dehydrogenase family protein molybdopterin-binding subunit [Pseudonocardia abyssalis]
MAHHRFASPPPAAPRAQVSRRSFLGFVIAAPTLVVAAEMTTGFLGLAPSAAADPLVSVPQTPEIYDLLDALRDAARPTANLIRIQVNRDSTVSFDLPRSDNGQDIIGYAKIVIAEEMGLDPEQVIVTLADARPELLFNQLTGGSSTVFTTYTPIRVAAAIAAGRLLNAAAAQLQQEVNLLTTRRGVITDTLGAAIPIGDLAEIAASDVTEPVEVLLKPREEFSVIGKPRNKHDQRAMVTGAKKFVTDLKIPDALPTMVCRAPTLNGTVESVDNIDEVRRMPGVTDVEVVGTGIAVRAATFGQCIDAIQVLRAQWGAGTAEGASDDSVLEQVRAAQLPLVVPAGVVGESIESEHTFYFRSGSSLETNSAIADVRAGSAEIWGPAKNPIAAQGEIAKILGLPVGAVTFHVVQGGGSFGRKLFFDGALEAAEISQKMGKPVNLMWHRADDSRVGRVHPLCTSRIRAVVAGDKVLSFEQRHTSVSSEINPGLGEPITAAAIKAPLANLTFSESVFELTQVAHYDFGVSTRLLNEVDMRFNTQSTRNIYSPDVTAARELMVDQIAEQMGKDPYEFRREFLKSDRARGVLDKVAEEGDWGRSMPEGTAQGIGFHFEYKGVSACLVEIDCRPETVNRPIREGVTGPRVTKVTFAIDPGLVINPRGIEAQMMGGINDAIANILTAGLHLQDGYFVEASWDNYFYTRQWNTPIEMDIHIVDSGFPEPGGIGEAGVASTGAAVANAYRRATGITPEYFPIHHKEPFPFEPKPVVPPIPQSPTDGLDFTF